MKSVTDPCWSEARLTDVVELVRRSHGLDLSPFNRVFLTKSLIKRQAAVSAGCVDDYFGLLGESLPEAMALQLSLFIIYSEFFRNPLAFSLLEKVFLPQILDEKERSGHGEIRVWSAGCATGQEAWSVAILLNELQRESVSFRLIATDRSEPALAQARAGVYSAEALGNVRMRHVERYFARQGESFVIDPGLAERVNFSVYDLLDESTICPPESIFGNFDLVLCCNVLFYYRPQMQQRILQKIRRCLSPGGYLVTDEAERGIVETAGGFLPAAQLASVFGKMSN